MGEDDKSDFAKNPDLMLEVLAKLVHRLGGYVVVTHEEHPSGPFNLASRYGNKQVELRLLDHNEHVV